MIIAILQKLSRSSHYWDAEANASALAADFVSISSVNHELKALEDESCWPERLVLVGPYSVDYLHWLAKRAQYCTSCGIWKDYEALRAIASGCPKLRHIKIRERWAEPTHIPEDILVALAEGCPDLESVDFGQGVLDLDGLLAVLDNCKNLEELRFVPLDNDYEPFLRGAIGTHVVNKTVEYISFFHQTMSLEKDLMPLLRLCPNVELVRFEMDPCDLGDEDFSIENNTASYFEEVGSQYYRCAFVDYYNNYIDGEDWFR
ncbi:hypothetical protein KFL_001020050 [Klebsormidium nitens]|uniref:Uncharacterized protein n=1 Tax=Klebsormidium nitens TaxID=105231 RepID=A0A1Y1HU51_KLENI|nr:hypothetical protein KFL_001020050 [Klebsormidium nitens]|eukprot:GAQ82154.1 hypothetical protein KFL_001020050 [Klebsormidium nitens]